MGKGKVARITMELYSAVKRDTLCRLRKVVGTGEHCAGINGPREPRALSFLSRVEAVGRGGQQGTLWSRRQPGGSEEGDQVGRGSVGYGDETGRGITTWPLLCTVVMHHTTREMESGLRCAQ